tara:strand:- start:105 stop:758 length:654 start_codon:yes stop_codon:yes gene_type:complete
MGRFDLTMKKVFLLTLGIINYSFGQVDYQTEIQTIFTENCTGCHGNSGGLSLTSYGGVMAGGNSGAVIEPGNHGGSLLWQEVNSGAMPEDNPNLSSDEINLIAQWIDEGALEQPALMTQPNAWIPKEYILNQNHPNPFNPVTSLSYDLPEDSFVSITIYDMLGNVINNLVNTYQLSGYKIVQWDATNNQGQPVSAGVYLYSIEAGKFRQTKKMILLK